MNISWILYDISAGAWEYV